MIVKVECKGLLEGEAVWRVTRRCTRAERSGKVRVGAGAKARGWAQPEVEVQDGQEVPGGVGSIGDERVRAGEADCALDGAHAGARGQHGRVPPGGRSCVRDHQDAVGLVSLCAAKCFTDEWKWRIQEDEVRPCLFTMWTEGHGP